MKPLRKRVRVQAYVEPELARRIIERVQSTGASESGVVRSSLVESLDGVSDSLLTLRRLNQLGHAVARLHRDVEFYSEAFAIFVRTWLMHTPPLAESQHRVAMASADGRYAEFIDALQRQFTGGRRFLDDLPKEPLANDAELDAILARSDRDKGRAH